ncbi:amino acid adenylation domain-containing protein [Nocardia sp. NBC_00508]|uniref:amino acid adenylation domain-containing protein n=1 Tax=Nocardia sp. NBC_00508 TaxID=2975992 RepID=UPI002E81BCF1|nr:amino acid adenylation domain-containing protein [Nocardia sp. NBC_00508]WUD68713.1 amino acid adenylation domain-containing protein [Nocardia sp. NBC_00508]
MPESTHAPQIEDVLALSPLQEGLFSLARLAGEGDLYAVQFVLEITGPLDAALLHRSADAILRRHPNLRASFWDQDLPRPVQIVPTAAELPWVERSAAPTELEEIIAAQARRPFDLARGPLLRMLLVTLPDDTRRLIITAHHILLDGWSLGVFFRELYGLYETGAQADALPGPRPYRDYIGWLAARDTGAAIHSWTEYLASVDPLILADRTDGAVNTTVPEIHTLTLDVADTDRLTAWARTNGLTMNTVVQYAWAVLLGRLTDRADVVFGTTVSGRPDELTGVETMIGLFINTIPIRIRLDDSKSGVEAMLAWQRESAAMRDLAYVSLSSIQRAVGAGTLFDTLFVFENAPMSDVLRPTVTADGTRFRPITSESLTHYPLAVTSFVYQGQLVVVVEEVAAALGALSGHDIGDRLLSVLRQLPEVGERGQDAFDILLPGEQPQPPADPATDVRGHDVPELFARRVAATPEAVALSTTDESLTYRQLSDAAGRLSGVLTAHGVGPEDVVALAMPRSARSIVAILAVLSAGAAYVPVDIDLPAARIESILRQARPRLILRDSAQPGALYDIADLPQTLVLDTLSEDLPVATPVAGSPDRCAYLIFTSGSTGEPKGVMGTHASLVSYFADHRDRVYRPAVARLGRALRIAHAWSLSFDASWQPLIGLLDGHAIHLFDAEEMRDASRLVDGIVRQGLDMIDTTPSMFTQLAAAGLVQAGRTPLSVLALGGEAIGVPLWKQLCALPGTAVHNCYGPTETTVEAVVAAVTEAHAEPTIGLPVTGMAGYVLDSRLQAMPPGVVGELYLSGAQLTRGYVGKPGITADRFVADPFRAGARMYRTGDLVRRLPSGALAYLGRADDQVKIRGYRIEIGDIETALLALPGVRAAAVVVVRRAGGPSLVACAVGDGLVAAQLRAALAEQLPGYMVPHRILVVEQLPVTSNGKLDTTRIASLAEDTAAGAGAASAPARTATERGLCAAVAELSGGTVPGIDDDLVSLGVDSIVAITLVNRLRREGKSISPKLVLTASTIRELAARIDAGADRVRESTSAGYGAVDPTPIVSWMHEYGGYRRLVLSNLLELPADIDQDGLTAVLQALLDGHDMLRARFADTPGGYELHTREPGTVRADQILSRVDEGADFEATLAAHGHAVVDEIDPFTGDLVRAVWFVRSGAPDVLLLTIHHLAIDPVSWHIVSADLAAGWAEIVAGRTPTAAVEHTGYRQWARLLNERAGTAEVSAQRDYWMRQVSAPDPVLGARMPDPRSDTWASYRVRPVPATAETTAAILDGIGGGAGVREFLLTALTMTVSSWRAERGQDAAAGACIALEGHGREDTVLGADADSAHTVGWFTTIVPARLGVGADGVDVATALADPARAAALLETITTHLAELPNGGVDYGVLRYLDEAPELVDAPQPQVLFDYLGRFDLSGAGRPWAPIPELALHECLPLVAEPDFPLRYALDVISAVRATAAGPQLVTMLRWSEAVFTAAEVDRLAELWHDAVAALERAVSAVALGAD